MMTDPSSSASTVGYHRLTCNLAPPGEVTQLQLSSLSQGFSSRMLVNPSSVPPADILIARSVRFMGTRRRTKERPTMSRRRGRYLRRRTCSS